MAVRSKVLQPDQQILTHNGPVNVVSREAIREAFLDFEAVGDVAGGVISIVYVREPTGAPGEMVTTGVMLQWKDRTDARPQAEAIGSAAVVIPAPEPAPAPQPRPPGPARWRRTSSARRRTSTS
jgi:hypothetical protein